MAQRVREGGLVGAELLPEELAKLRQFVELAGLRQKDLARAFDTDIAVISRGLTGEAPFSLARLRLVCKMTGHQVGDLFEKGPITIEPQHHDLTPAEIAGEMERLARMLRRVTQQQEPTPPVRKKKAHVEAVIDAIEAAAGPEVE